MCSALSAIQGYSAGSAILSRPHREISPSSFSNSCLWWYVVMVLWWFLRGVKRSGVVVAAATAAKAGPGVRASTPALLLTTHYVTRANATSPSDRPTHTQHAAPTQPCSPMHASPTPPESTRVCLQAGSPMFVAYQPPTAKGLLRRKHFPPRP